MKKVWFSIFLMSTVCTSAFATYDSLYSEPDTFGIVRSFTITLDEWQADVVKMDIISKERSNRVYSNQLTGIMKETVAYLAADFIEARSRILSGKQSSEGFSNSKMDDHELRFSQREWEEVFHPVVMKKGKYLELSFSAAPSRTYGRDNVSEKLRNSSFNFDRAVDIVRRIDISHLKSGSYTLITEVGDKSYYSDFIK